MKTSLIPLNKTVMNLLTKKPNKTIKRIVIKTKRENLKIKTIKTKRKRKKRRRRRINDKKQNIGKFYLKIHFLAYNIVSDFLHSPELT